MLSLLIGLSLCPLTEPLIRFEVSQAETIITAWLGGALPRVPQGPLDRTSGEALLRVYLLTANVSASEPILGDYTCSGQRLIFRPRYPITPGCTYRAELHLPGEGIRTTDYTVPPRTPRSPPKVLAIYPSTDAVPANLLKFYILFSQPMQEGAELFDHIHILDEKNIPVEDPWRRTELWNDDRTCLTLWIHPGRTKQGVNLREEFGPVLAPGRRYTLVIEPRLADESGQRLAEKVSKTFRTTPPVTDVIDSRQWQLYSPRLGSREPVRVLFPRALDRGLLERSLTIRDSEGRDLPGKITLSRNETEWQFTPINPWTAKRYVLHIGERLEDLAGNTPIRPFDFDRFAPPMDPSPLTLEFSPRP